MNRRLGFGIIVALIVVLVASAIGSFIYQAGVAQGVAQAVITEGGTSAPGFSRGYLVQPFPFGFGLFHILGVLAFLFIIFFIVRTIFWFGFMRRRAFDGWARHWDGDAVGGDKFPHVVEEWHRRMHQRENEQSSAKGTPLP